jgi:hypothetical protein
MAKKTSSSPATPRKRTTPRKEANGDVETAAAGVTIGAPDPTDEDIRVRAYHRYLERGGGHGADFDDWVEAEKDLKSSQS